MFDCSCVPQQHNRASWQGHFRKGLALFCLGRAAEAASAYLEGLKHDPQNVALRQAFDKAMTQLKLDRFAPGGLSARATPPLPVSGTSTPAPTARHGSMKAAIAEGDLLAFKPTFNAVTTGEAVSYELLVLEGHVDPRADVVTLYQAGEDSSAQVVQWQFPAVTGTGVASLSSQACADV